MQSNHVDADKTNLLWEIVEQRGSALGQEEKEQFFALTVENADIFAVSKSDLGHTTKLKHSINTGTAMLIRQAIRRLPSPQKKGNSSSF